MAQRERGGLTKPAIKTALLDEKGKDKPEAQKLEYLRLQIEMRLLGLGWTEYATRWSSKADDRIGTVAHLHSLLEEIFDNERGRARFTPGTERGLPTEAAPPQTGMATVGQLGTADADASAVSAKAIFSADELRKKADAERQRRVEAGISPMASRGCSPTRRRRSTRRSSRWKYHNKDTNEPHLIWATGRVTQIADGVNHKKSKACKKILPAGAVLWASAGRGTRTRSLTRRRASGGSSCCPKSGRSSRSTAGALRPTRAGCGARARAADPRRKDARRRECGRLMCMSRMAVNI